MYMYVHVLLAVSDKVKRSVDHLFEIFQMERGGSLRTSMVSTYIHTMYCIIIHVLIIALVIMTQCIHLAPGNDLIFIDIIDIIHTNKVPYLVSS